MGWSFKNYVVKVIINIYWPGMANMPPGLRIFAEPRGHAAGGKGDRNVNTGLKFR